MLKAEVNRLGFPQLWVGFARTASWSQTAEFTLFHLYQTYAIDVLAHDPQHAQRIKEATINSDSFIRRGIVNFVSGAAASFTTFFLANRGKFARSVVPADIKAAHWADRVFWGPSLMLYGGFYLGLFETLRSYILPLPPHNRDIDAASLSKYQVTPWKALQLFGSGLLAATLAELAIHPLNIARGRSILRGMQIEPNYVARFITYQRRMLTTIPLGTALLEDLAYLVKQRGIGALFDGAHWRVPGRALTYGFGLATFACVQNTFLLRRFVGKAPASPPSL